MWELNRRTPRFPSVFPGGPIAVPRGKGNRRGSPTGAPFSPWKTGQRKSLRNTTGRGSGMSWPR
eukprot:7792382-Heterocapsa_arctica.AAC.1